MVDANVSVVFLKAVFFNYILSYNIFILSIMPYVNTYYAYVIHINL